MRFASNGRQADGGIVGVGQDPHVVKAGGEDRVERLGGTDERDVGLAVEDRAHPVDRRDRAGGAGGRVDQSRSVNAEAVRHARRHGGVEQVLPPRFDLSRPLAAGVFLGHPGRRAAAGAVGTCNPRAVAASEVETAVFERFTRRGHRNRKVAIAEAVERNAFHRRAEQEAVGNPRHAAEFSDAVAARLHGMPRRLAVLPDGSDHADAGDNDAIVHEFDGWLGGARRAADRGARSGA